MYTRVIQVFIIVRHVGIALQKIAVLVAIDQTTVMSLQYARVEDMQEEKNIKKCIEKSEGELKGLHVCRK